MSTKNKKGRSDFFDLFCPELMNQVWLRQFFVLRDHACWQDCVCCIAVIEAFVCWYSAKLLGEKPVTIILNKKTARLGGFKFFLRPRLAFSHPTVFESFLTIRTRLRRLIMTALESNLFTVNAYNNTLCGFAAP